MKCEICKINEASVHFKQVNDGETHEMFACEQCAAKNGFDPESPMSLTDFLFGVGMQAEPVFDYDDKKSCSCGLTRAEFLKKSRAGCQCCYEVFSVEMDAMIESMHKGVRHVGKVPATAMAVVEVESLQNALDEAVRHEDFEEAAILRDRMRDICGGEKV